MKRLTAMLLVVLMLFTSGCQEPNTTDWSEYPSTIMSDEEPEPTTAPTSRPLADPLPITVLENGAYYDSLDDDLKANYRQIVDELYRYSGEETMSDGKPALTIHLDVPCRDMERLQRLYYAVYYDHPEFFYLNANGVTADFSFGRTKITIPYTMDRFYRAVEAISLEDEVSSLVSRCQEQGLSELETELRLHDYVVICCQYDDSAANATVEDEQYIRGHSPYYALCERSAICGGYTRALQLLLSRAGIPATTVINEDHMWNMVWIDGEPYHVDVTWDDADEYSAIHHYFNITEAEIRATRSLPEQYFDMPEATATAANYHTYNEYVYDGDEFDEEFEKFFIEEVLFNDESVEIKIDPDRYDEFIEYIDSDAVSCMINDLNVEVITKLWRKFSYISDEDIGTFTFIPKGKIK